MINDDEEITVIDFPQMTSTSHINAQFYFERDVRCIQQYFTKRFGLVFEGVPILENDVERTCDLDKEIKASGCYEQGLSPDEMELMDAVQQSLLDHDHGEHLQINDE